MRLLILLYLLILSPAIFAQWEAKHNLSATEFQKTLNALNAKGYKPGEISFVAPGSFLHFTALWSYAPKTKWEAKTNITGPELQSYFDKLTPKGYMPTEIVSFNQNGTPKFGAIWEYNPKAVWVARYDLSAKEYQQYFDKLSPEGYVPTEITAYNIGPEPLFAAVWVKQPESVWQARHNLTDAELQNCFDQFSKQGYMPTELFAYKDQGETKFGCVWMKKPIAWEAWYGLSSQQYQQKFNNIVEANYHPYLVSTYLSNGEVRYMLAWEILNRAKSIDKN